MKKKIAYLFPGQGSQYVGMGKDFTLFEAAKKTFEEADDLLKENLSQIIWEGPMEKLTETRYSQPAIFVVSAAILHTLKDQAGLEPSFTAGLSLGEYTALYAAGKLSFSEALLLVQKRALFMDEACRKTKGAMSAVLGLDYAKIESVLTSLKKEAWIANCNAPGQIVISGSPEALQEAAVLLKEAGAKRVIPLQVHGAFHSPFMESAREKLEPYIRKARFIESSIDVAMNVPGKIVSFSEIPDLLIRQVVSSVRWDESVGKLKEKGAECFLEIGCGKTLTGLNRKIVPDMPSVSLEKIEELDTFLKETSYA